MRVGEIVIRSYAFHKRIFGTIIGIKKVGDLSGVDPDWEETHVKVMWADGTVTSESDCELDYSGVVP